MFFCMFSVVTRIAFRYNLNVIQKDDFKMMEQIRTKIQNLYVDFLKKNEHGRYCGDAGL